MAIFAGWERWQVQQLGTRFVSEKDGKAVRRHLEQLLSKHLHPHLERVLHAQGLNTLEVREGAQAALLQQLTLLRERQLPAPDLFELTEAVSYQAMGQHLNTLQPARRQLQLRVLSILRSRADRFLLVTGAGGELLTGVTSAGRATTSAPWQRLVSAPASAGAPIKAGIDPASESFLTELLERILSRVKHQVLVSALVGVVAALTDLPEPPPVAPEENLLLTERLEAVFLLRQLWEALKTLPVRQRVILLLGAQDDAGRSLLSLLTRHEITNEAELAQVMEIGPRSFPVLLRELPCSDNRLAELLKLTTENVRHQRQSARLRLQNQLELWGDATS
jgi:hypothetical protein